MTRLIRILLASALANAPLAFGAESAPAPAKNVALDFSGKLRDGLKELATKGGINLVATGDLDQDAQLHLRDVSAEEALSTVAEAYHLKVQRKGSIWTLRPMTEAEREEGEDEPSPPTTPDAPSAAAALPSMPSPPEVGSKSESSGADEAELKTRLLKKMRKHQGKNDRVGTGNMVIEEDQVVDDAVTYGGTLTVNGVVEGDAVIFGGGVHLGPKAVVEGDVVAFGGTITKEAGAEIHGDEVAFGGGSLGAAIAKSVKRDRQERDGSDGKTSEDTAEEKADGAHSGQGVPGFLVSFAVLFGLGFLLLMFVPGRMKLIEAEVKREPVKCGVTGVVGALALIPLTLLLIVTIVGIPVALLLWVLVGVGLVAGLVAVANEIGARLPVLRARKTQAIVLAFGLLAVLLVGMIPVLGPLSMSVLSFVALGAVIRSRFGQRPRGFAEPDLTPTDPPTVA